MDRAASGHSSGKLILFGEHAVVYGHPAIGMAVNRGVQTQLVEGTGALQVDTLKPPVDVSKAESMVKALLHEALGPQKDQVDAKITIDLPPMAGLGGSAALAISALRARGEWLGQTEDPLALVARATEIECIAHGQSSGLDPVLCAGKGVQRFEKNATPPSHPIRPGAPITLVVGVMGSHGGTKQRVGGVRTLKERFPEAIAPALSTLGQCAMLGGAAIEAGDPERLGALATLAHGVLCGFTLVTPEIQALLNNAQTLGALGGKMSGAGHGGALFTVVPDQARADHVVDAWQVAGADAWVETLR